MDESSIEAEGSDHRTLGLWSATRIGVGAIVGGGIFVLAGVAFAAAGPAALVAFALNGVVAALTAMSFAEMSSAFPANGGSYTFAKKVLSVRSAFAAGWILWFAYIVAGVLYALGFASFAALGIRGLLEASNMDVPTWLDQRRLALLFASAATIWYAASFIRSAGGGGVWETVGKLVVFAALIVAGIVALPGQSVSTSADNLSPFFSGGGSGVLVAMGFTFIALQGFDLISAVGGEVKDPQRNIPRAMFLSLGCALLIYLPLIFLVSVVGVDPGESIAKLAHDNPETVIPMAAERFMGPVGYWLVIIAAILSTLSALSSNLLAASRVALTMAQDRTLPAVLSDLHPTRKTPVIAIYATALTLIAIVFMIPDLASAGAAASLIFLASFALVHVTTYLNRKRGERSGGYQTRWFPAIPFVGGFACVALGLFQAIKVPDAAGILALWLGLGVMLYWSLFARRAEIGDAMNEGMDPSLVSLRGQESLVLVPIANPNQAPAMVEVANAMGSRGFGQVLLLSVVKLPKEANFGVPQELENSEEAIGKALRLSYRDGYSPEALITAAVDPMLEIRRIAEEHQCGALVLGLGELAESGDSAIEALLNAVDADVALLRAAAGWRLASVKKILVPVGGRGDQHQLRARLLGSICRASTRQVTFARVLPPETSAREVDRARRELRGFAELNVRGDVEVLILTGADAGAELLREAENFDLMVMGLKSVGWRQKVFGDFAKRIAKETPCATLFLSRRRHSALGLLEPLRDDVMHTIKDAARYNPIRR